MKVLVVGSGGREHAICTFVVFLPLEENAFLAVGHHGKATEPDEPVVFRITTDF